VTLSAERAGSQVAITVADTGPGMDPELAAHAFDRFVKAPGSKGSGLGLSIARDIVEAHGGSISLASRPGSGTAVRLTLPQA
jgi:signal transduction histidine kinase